MPQDSFKAAAKIHILGVIFIRLLPHILLEIILLMLPIIQESVKLKYAPEKDDLLSRSAIIGLVAF